ncbi:alpha-E domain-containing protein, partial [Micrococcus sp. SIMBA_131]
MERAENNSRLIAVKLTSRLENANPIDETNQNWYELIEISGFQEVFDEEYHHPIDRNVMEFLLFSLKNPNS